MNRREHVVIIGAGFGGLEAAKGLRDQPVDVTLIDRHNFHTFQPLLYQVATAGLNATDVAYAVRGIFRKQPNLRFRQATVTGVDWAEHTLDLDHAGSRASVSFDRLIVAAGATAAFFGITGAAEHSFPLYTLEDAVTLRNHAISCFEAADADPPLVDDGVLTFVVVGGGPTGVEVAGALAELFDKVLRKDFGQLEVDRARIILIEMADSLLAPFSPPSQRHARDTLVRRGVDVRLGEAVAEVTPTKVLLKSGDAIAAHTLVWAAGVQANPLAAALNVKTGRAGRIAVGPDLRIADHPEAYAIGDIAAITDRDSGPDRVLPQLAQVAIQSGKHAANEIRRERDGHPSVPFAYHDKGIMATIGRRAAVAELPRPPLKLRGTLAWFAWLGLHLVYLVGFRNRLSVFINWAWNYFTYDHGPRIILDRDSAPEDDLRSIPSRAGP